MLLDIDAASCRALSRLRHVPLNFQVFLVFNYYLRQWNEGSIGGDYEIGRSVCPCVSVVSCVRRYFAWRRYALLRAPSPQQ